MADRAAGSAASPLLSRIIRTPARASPAAAEPSSGPISLTAPGVPPDQNEIDLPAEGAPGWQGAPARQPSSGASAYPPPDRYSAPYSQRAPPPRRAAARTGAARLGRRVRAGRGQTDGNARLSDRLGARSLACRFRAARRNALVRRPRGRDQADLRLFLPWHERQSARPYFRTRLWQRAGYRGVHAGRRTQHFGQGRLEGPAGRAGLPARCAGLGLPRILHRAGAGLQRLSLQSHPRRPDAARPPARHLRAGCDVRRGGRDARGAAQSLCVA